jgi:hypothetical protein
MENSCILWNGALDSHGYGQSWKYNKPFKAHRDAYERHHNIVLRPNEFVLHKCDTPACVNPNHLFLGTQQDNMDDKMRKGRHRVLRGEEKSTSKLTEVDIKYIRLMQGSQKDLARMFGVSQSTISLVRAGKRWQHV